VRLKVVVPTETVFDEQVTKVLCEGSDGAFCLLERHLDWLASLVQGIVTVQYGVGDVEYIAVDGGILVKCADEVLLSTGHAVRSRDLESLEELVREQFRVLEEQEKTVRTAVARLEADLVRRFFELGKNA